MTSDLRPYPEYKDSGLPWLGRIPAHWNCLPHRALFEEIKNQGHSEEPLLSVTISKGVIRQADLLANSSKKDSSNLDKSKYKLVEPEDIAYNKMRAWQGAVGVSRHRGIVSPAYVVVRLRERQNPEYFHYLFRTPGFAKEAERWSYGITSDMWSLRPEHFKMIYSSVPPREEQDAIVFFLHNLDKKVNRFIRNRRRLIEVLTEQKQAIINRAVTRGLDPNAPLKPSGIDWLGDIPVHWEVKRLKHLLVQPLKYGANAAAEHADRTLPRYIRITDIDKDGQLIDDRFRSISLDIAEQYMLQDGDILLARSGATVGKAFLYTDDVGPAAHAGYLIKARVDAATVRPRFLYALLQSAGYWRWIASMTIQATIQNVNAEKYANLWVTLPPMHEQDAILEAIKADTAALARVFDTAKREIDLIREYRTRLIADVVTGKVDVRGLAPDEPPSADEQSDEGIDDEEMLGDDEPELVEEAES